MGETSVESKYASEVRRLSRQCPAVWEVITPEVAVELLGGNIGNRAPKVRRQSQLTRDIVADKFVPNGETIIVGKTRLLDGQNRLYACIKAGVPIVSLVVRGMDDDAFDSLDQGTPRSVVDKLRQIDGVISPTNAAAMLAILWRFDTEKFRTAFGWQASITVSEAVETLGRHPDAMDAMSGIGVSARRSGFPVAAVTAMYLKCRESDTELAEDFFGRLVSGAGIEADEPVFRLRKRFLQNRTTKAKLSPMDQCVLIAKAWNATKTDTEMKQLKARRRKVSVADGTRGKSAPAATSETFPDIN